MRRHKRYCIYFLESTFVGIVRLARASKDQQRPRVGSRVWELLREPMSVTELCATLQDEFEVEPETCEGEVMALVQKLLDEKLVRAA